MGDLFDLKNFFVLGNYQAAINEAASLSDLTPGQQTERDVYMYRSYVAQGKYQLVMSEIRDSAAPALVGVKLLASYLHSRQQQQSGRAADDNRETVLVTLKSWMNDGLAAHNNAMLQLLAGTVYYLDGNYEQAMRCVMGAGGGGQGGGLLEAQALLVQIYLAIERPEMAEKEVRSMQQKDEDASIVQLATAWLYTAQGTGDRAQEAAGIYTELVDKYGPSALLLNGLAVTALLTARYSDAEKYALQALEKNPADAEALINVVAAQQLQGKQELVNRNLSQLQSTAGASSHGWLRTLKQAEDSFGALAAAFS